MSRVSVTIVRIVVVDGKRKFAYSNTAGISDFPRDKVAVFEIIFATC